MRRRTAVEKGDAPPAELDSIIVWCEKRGLDGHLTGEAWNDGTVSAWTSAREAFGLLDYPSDLLRVLPHAPFHPEDL